MKKRLISILALALAALFLATGCGSSGKTLIKSPGGKISVNVYELYLSRMKGTLARAGENVNSAAYWEQYTSLDGETLADYYEGRVLEGLKQIAAALCLYDELGLKLPAETKKDIDEWIDGLVESVGGGSKAVLNSVLASYGANIETLREASLIEAKIEQLKTELYGENASKVLSTAKEEFYQLTYYRGKQMLIANYYHEYDTDADGRMIYYKTNADGTIDKGQIAYDTAATAETDGEGNTVYKTFGAIAYDTAATASADRDAVGDIVYYTADGKIAYDTANGVAAAVKNGEGETVPELDKNGDRVYRKWVTAYDAANGAPYYHLDKNGDNVIAYYTEAEMSKRLWIAERICADCKGNEPLFDAYTEEFSDNTAFNETYAPNGLYFAAGTTTSDTVFHTISTELAKLEIGELSVLASDSGYYIIMRVALDEGAWQAEENAAWFTALNTLVVEYMLQKRTAAYMEQIKLDEALLATVDITKVAANNYY